MEQEWKELLEENNALLRENLELSQENAKKIKRIHSSMRRTFIARILYWCILVLLAAGAAYAVRPYVANVLDTYKKIQNQVDTAQDFIENPTSAIKDLGILNKLFNF